MPWSLRFGRLLDSTWKLKRRLSRKISSNEIDAVYETAVRNGAIGGKLIGAGGGGFLMFYAKDTAKLRHAMLAAGLQEVRFRFDFEGTKVIVS